MQHPGFLRFPLRFTPGDCCALLSFCRAGARYLNDGPAVAAQLASEWQLSPARIGYLFSTELGNEPATVPARWWMRRISWRKVALGAVGVFCWLTCFPRRLPAMNLCSGPLRRLSGRGTLMILCISCAAATANPSRTYAFWVLGQLLLGIAGLLALPPLFAVVGLKAAYLGLAAIAAPRCRWSARFRRALRLLNAVQPGGESPSPAGCRRSGSAAVLYQPERHLDLYRRHWP